MQAQLGNPTVSMAGGAARQTPATSAISHAINNFSVLGGAKTDFSAGSLENTGNELDVALNGPGFITVAAPSGTAYTRNGSLSLGPNGELLSSGGAAVLGKDGPIQLPPGQVSIGSDGTVTVNGAVVDQIQLAEFDKSTPPLQVGASLFVAAPGAAAKPAEASTVLQGFLEGSNMNVIGGSVGLVGLQRNAEMLEKALTMFNNDFNRTAIEQVAKTS